MRLWNGAASGSPRKIALYGHVSKKSEEGLLLGDKEGLLLGDELGDSLGELDGDSDGWTL